MINEEIAQVYHAKEMETFALIGNQWQAWADRADEKGQNVVEPVIHKSLALVAWGQARVLLTQDVVVP